MTVIEPQALLLLPRLRVQNANAISSPLTWGFPAVTAFTGFVHALHRQLAQEFDIVLDGVGIVCHHLEAQVSQPAGKRTKVFNLTRNPVGKDGSTLAIVEEGRVHLDISLIIGVAGKLGRYDEDERQIIERRAGELVAGMRIAGGSVLPSLARGPRDQVSLLTWPGTADDERRFSRKLALRLLPGFALVSREALLQQHLDALRERDPGLSALDALLDLSRLNIEPPSIWQKKGAGQDTENADLVASSPADNDWQVRRSPGWLVPIPVGYAAISPLYGPGEVRNARDREIPFRFVETLFSMGQWLSPHRLDDIRQLLWFHQADESAGLYRCTTPFSAVSTLYA